MGIREHRAILEGNKGTTTPLEDPHLGQNHGLSNVLEGCLYCFVFFSQCLAVRSLALNVLYESSLEEFARANE